MKKLLIAATALAMLAPGAALADVTGAWKLKVDVAGMIFDVNCNLTQSGTALGGTCVRADAMETAPALTGSVDGSNVSWAYDVTFQDMPLHVVYKGATTSDSAMSGTIEVAGQNGTFVGAK